MPTEPLHTFATAQVRFSGQLDSLSTRKSPVGYSLVGSLRLDAPFRGRSTLALQLPMGSSLMPGDHADLEGLLLTAPDESAWLFDCSR